MEIEQMEKRVSHQSTIIYLPVSLGAALAFLLAASMYRNYPLVAKLGGIFWVGLLSLIVAMLVVTAKIKRKIKNSV